MTSYVASESLLQILNLPPCLFLLSCFCHLQKTQDMTMTLRQSLSPVQVAHVFPLLLRYVHVSTMSHHANCILIPLRLEWFLHILDAKIICFCCSIDVQWHLTPIYFIFSSNCKSYVVVLFHFPLISFFPQHLIHQQIANKYITSQDSDPAAAF